jgi:hypothetical protein
MWSVLANDLECLRIAQEVYLEPFQRAYHRKVSAQCFAVDSHVLVVPTTQRQWFYMMSRAQCYLMTPGLLSPEAYLRSSTRLLLRGKEEGQPPRGILVASCVEWRQVLFTVRHASSQ